MRSYRWLLVVLSLLTLTGFGTAAYALNDRFQQGARTRIAICQQINTVKSIIHDEHVTRLTRTKDYLQAHPRGTHDIPLALLLQSIKDENKIVNETQPTRCQ